MRKFYLCNYEVSVCLPPVPPFPAPESVISLPPLDCLRFFEAAARHRSFVRAAEELGVTPPAVAHRIRMLEKHLDAELFERRRRSVRLNAKGRAYLKEVQRILAEVHGVSKQQRSTPRRVRIVSVEAVAEKWLLSRQVGLRAPSKSHGIGPRLHDMRHRFAVNTLLRWYRDGVDVERHIPRLATWLGHTHVSDTYWYLTATPELMQIAARRLDRIARRSPPTATHAHAGAQAPCARLVPAPTGSPCSKNSSLSPLKSRTLR